MEETFKYRKPDMLMISIQSHKRVVDAENMVSSIARSLMVRSFYSGYSTITLRVGTGQFSELVHQFELPVLEVDQFSIRELVDQFSAENCQFELAVPPAILRQSFNWSG
jgi:hypothetical protein